MTDPIPEPFQWPPSVELRRDPASIARHREALRAVVQSQPDPVAGLGRGIVYVGGGRYWPGIVVGVRVLRELWAAVCLLRSGSAAITSRSASLMTILYYQLGI